MSNRPYYPNGYIPSQPPPHHHPHSPQVRYYLNVPPPTLPQQHPHDKCCNYQCNDNQCKIRNGEMKEIHYNVHCNHHHQQIRYYDCHNREYLITSNEYVPSNPNMRRISNDRISPNHSIAPSIPISHPCYKGNNHIHHTITRDDRPSSMPTNQSQENRHHRPAAVYRIGVQPVHKNEMMAISSPQITTALSIEENNKNNTVPQITPVSVVSTNRSFDSSISSIDNGTNNTNNSTPKSIESIRSEIENDVRNRKASSHFFSIDISNVKNIQYLSPRYNHDGEKSKLPSPSSCSTGITSPTKKGGKKCKMYSNYIGVTFNKTHGKYQACITHYRKQHYLGRYKLSTDAALAYDKGAKLLKGQGWKINFSSDDEYWAARCKEEQEKLHQNTSPTSASSTPKNSTYHVTSHIHPSSISSQNSPMNKRRKLNKIIGNETNFHHPTSIEMSQSEDSRNNDGNYNDISLNHMIHNRGDVMRLVNLSSSEDIIVPLKRNLPIMPSISHHSLYCDENTQEEQFHHHSTSSSSSSSNLINPNDSRDDDNIITNYYPNNGTNNENSLSNEEHNMHREDKTMINNRGEIKVLSSPASVLDNMVEAASVLMTLNKK